MADSRKMFQDQHDVVEKHKDNTQTPEDIDDDVLEGGEVADNLDEIHQKAFGDEDEKSTITEEIDKDEILQVKDLKKEEQSSKNH